MIVLIRSSLDALNQANSTNNYTVLNALGSDRFAAQNPPAKLAQAFAPLRANAINLAAALIVPPLLDQPAKVEQGRLQLAGHFDTRPQVIHFDLIFEPNRGGWRMADLNVGLTMPKPAAPAAAKP